MSLPAAGPLGLRPATPAMGSIMLDPNHTDQTHAAFVELARITLADHSLEAVLGKVAELTKQTVPGAHEVSVTVLERAKPKTVAFTGPLALHLDERQYEQGHGPCLHSVEASQCTHIDSVTGETRWPRFIAQAKEHGAGSILAVPIPLQRELSAGLNIYSTDERAFDSAAIILATTFADYAGVAISNMHLYETQSETAEQLQLAMQSRAVIEQAKGILMGQRRCSAEEAFGILADLSQKHNRKLRHLAQMLVDEVAAGRSGQDG